MSEKSRKKRLIKAIFLVVIVVFIFSAGLLLSSGAKAFNYSPPALRGVSIQDFEKYIAKTDFILRSGPRDSRTSAVQNFDGDFLAKILRRAAEIDQFIKTNLGELYAKAFRAVQGSVSSARERAAKMNLAQLVDPLSQRKEIGEDPSRQIIDAQKQLEKYKVEFIDSVGGPEAPTVGAEPDPLAAQPSIDIIFSVSKNVRKFIVDLFKKERGFRLVEISPFPSSGESAQLVTQVVERPRETVREIIRVDTELLEKLSLEFAALRDQQEKDVEALRRSIALSQRINNLGPSGNTPLTITQPTISGAVQGNLSATGHGSIGGNFSIGGELTVLGTGTSTFAGGIEVLVLNITSAAASSTFANGIQLSAGCFRLPDGTCAGAGSGGSVNAGTAGRLAFYPSTGTTVDDQDLLHMDTANFRLGIATTTPFGRVQIAATSTPTLVLTDNNGGSNLKHFYASSSAGDLALGRVTDDLATLIEIARFANTGRLGIGTTSPYAKLSVAGLAAFESFQATSTTATSTISGALGIGTTTPAEKLAIAGNLYVGGNGTSTVENNLHVRGTFQAGAGSVFLTANSLQATAGDFSVQSGGGARLVLNTGLVGVGSSTPWAKFSVEQGTTSPVFVVSDEGTSTPHILIDGLGRVGIGTSSPSRLFSVAGNTYITGGLGIGIATTTAGSAAFTGTIDIQRTTASSTFANGIQLSAGCFAISGRCTVIGSPWTSDIVAAIIPSGLTTWDVTSAAFKQVFSVSSQSGNPTDVFFKPDGTRMYVVGPSTVGPGFNPAIFQYTLSTAWDISTAGFNTSFGVVSDEAAPEGIFFKPDGTRMYMLGSNGDDVTEYTVSPAWSVSGATLRTTFSVSAQNNLPRGIFFKPDGTRMFVTGWGTGNIEVHEYALSTQWDISTASFVQEIAVSGEEASPNDVSFKPDGTKMYIIGETGDDITEYDLTTAWDISTATAGDTFSVAGQETEPQGFFFKPDGAKVYVIGTIGDDVNEYTLSTAVAGGGNFIVTDGGSLGLGTTSPSALLAVHGNAYISGNLVNVANITATGTLSAGAATTTHLAVTTAASTTRLQVSQGFGVGGVSTTTFGSAVFRGNLDVQGTTASSTFANGIQLAAGCFRLPDGTCAGTGGANQTPWTSDIDSDGFDLFDIGGIRATSGQWMLGTTTPAFSRSLAIQGGGFFAGDLTAANFRATGTIKSDDEISVGTAADLTVIQASQILMGSVSSLNRNSGTGQLRLSTNAGSIYLNPTAGVGVATGTAWGLLSVEMDTTNPSFSVSNEGSSTPAFFIGGVNQNGRIGIGTSSPAQLFSVSGNTYITGGLGVGAIASTTGSGVFTGTLDVQSTTASSTFAGGVVIQGGGLRISTLNCSGSGNLLQTDASGNLECGTDDTSAGQQTPWLSDIDGDGFDLFDVANITATSGTWTIGTTSPAFSRPFAIQGGGFFAGDLTAANFVATGTLTATNATTTILAVTSHASTSQQTVSLGFGVGSAATTTVGSASFSNVIDVRGTAATSTFANGIQIAAGCFRLPDGTCAGTGGGSGSGTVNSGTAGRLAFYPSTGTTVDDQELLHMDTANFRLGIATTTPFGRVQIAATSTPTLVLTDNNGGSNLKHFYASSSAGDLALGRVTDDLATLIEIARFANTGRLGIGTTSPYAKLSVAGLAAFESFQATSTTATSTLAGPLGAYGGTGLGRLILQGATTTGEIWLNPYGGRIHIASGTPMGPSFLGSNGLTVATSTYFGGARIGIGTTTPYARFGLMGRDGNTEPLLVVASSTNEEYFSISSAGTTTISNLALGALSFETNAGIVTWFDLPVTSNAAVGTPEGYTAQIDGTDILTIYAQSHGDGGIDRHAVGIGTSTPYGLVAIDNSTIGSTTPALLIKAAGTGQGTVAIAVDSGDTCQVGGTQGTCVLTDLAELFPISDNSEAGDIVMFDPKNSVKLKKALAENRSKLAGVVSTAPAMVFEGSSLKALGGIYQTASGTAPLALAGRIPTKVNIEGGEIKIGDPITISSVPGVGKKATAPGQIVGYALQEFSTTAPNAVDKILVFANLGYWMGVNPMALTASSSEEISDAGGLLAQIIDALLEFFKNAIVKIKELTVDKLRIGNTENPAGITIYDFETGQPYCVIVRGGKIENIPGECTFEAAGGSTSNPSSEVEPPQIDDSPQIDSDNGTSGVQNTEETATSTPSEPVPEPTPEPAPELEPTSATSTPETTATSTETATTTGN